MPGKFVAPSAATNDTLKGAALALKLMPRTMRNDLNKKVRVMGNDVWRPAVSARAVSRMDTLVLAKGARVKPGNPLTLVAASSKRPLRKGTNPLIPEKDWRGFEFGSTSKGNKREYERRNRTAGGTHTVNRRTQRQMPGRATAGRVVYQAAADVAPKITAFWVQYIVREIYEAHEGK